MAVYRHEVLGNRRKIKRLRYDGKYDTSHASTCRAISFWACAKSQAVLAYLVLPTVVKGKLALPGSGSPRSRGEERLDALLCHTIVDNRWLFYFTLCFRDPLTPVCRGAQPPASSVQGGCSPPRPPASYASDPRLPLSAKKRCKIRQ